MEGEIWEIWHFSVYGITRIAKSTFLKYPVGRKFDKIALSRMVKEIQANLCLSIFCKNSKIQNGRHMWEEEFLGRVKFFENCQKYIA